MRHVGHDLFIWEGRASAPAPSPLYKRRGTGAARHSADCCSSKISATPSSLEKAANRLRSPRRRPRRQLPLPVSAMAPKSDKAKGKAVKSAEALRLEALRKETATFPPQLDALRLKNEYLLFWSTATRAHPRTRVLPAIAQNLYPTGYPFFAVFFLCGLCPPFSEFFCDIMHTYNLHLLDFTPNAVLTMAVFAHLFENFFGVRPNVAPFRHFFTPRGEKGEPLSGGGAWISRTGKKEAYLEGELHGRWEEWRAEWCLIVEENPPPFTAVRRTPEVRGRDWSDLAPDDAKLKIAATRILRLRFAGPTVGAVGADFLRRRIAPLQERGKPDWEFQNAADIMRLRPGLNYNFTVLELDGVLKELFKHDSEHPEWFRLLPGVVPLCNNSALNRILTMMPLCDSHGIDATWQEPADDVVQAFFDNLEEVPVDPDEKRGLTRDTTPEELAYIASRMEEAAAAAAAGESGFTLAEADAAEAESLADQMEFAGAEEPAGHGGAGEPAQDASGLPEVDAPSSQLPGSSSQAEPPAQPRRRLRRAGEVVRQADQQPQPRVTCASEAAGEGSSRAVASAPAAPRTAAATGEASSTAPAKRSRGPTPLSPRAWSKPVFDYSALSSDDEEEDGE